MAKTSAELEKEFIVNSKSLTGNTLEEWLEIVSKTGQGKRNDIMDHLKKEYGVNHMQAQFIAGISLNNGNPVYSNENDLFEIHFQKAPEMKEVFNHISDYILCNFQGTQLIPKKTYLSLTEAREFVAINIKTNEVRIGLDLGDYNFNEKVLKSKLTGPMPRFSHMIIIKNSNEFNSDIKELISKSFDRTHKK